MASFPCCCENYKELNCDVKTCYGATLDFPFTAIYTGDYRVALRWIDTNFWVSAPQTAGHPLTMPTHQLNERTEFVVTGVFAPNDDTNILDANLCFTFKTTQNNAVSF